MNRLQISLNKIITYSIVSFTKASPCKIRITVLYFNCREINIPANCNITFGQSQVLRVLGFFYIMGKTLYILIYAH